MHSANETAALRYLKISKLGSNAKAARPATFSVFFLKNRSSYPATITTPLTDQSKLTK
jgi:hypothetical protein